MKRLPLYLGLLILLVSLPIGVFLTTKTQTSFPTRASFQGAALSLSPSSSTISQNGSQLLLSLTTGQTQVDGVDVVLTFDLDNVDLSKVTPGSILKNPQTKILTNKVETDAKTKVGTLKFSAIFLTPQTFNNTLGSITIRPQGQSESVSLSFVTSGESPSGVFSHEDGKNILTTAQNGDYKIQ